MPWDKGVTPSSADLKDPRVVPCTNSTSAGNYPDPKGLTPAELCQTSEASSDEPSEGFQSAQQASADWSGLCGAAAGARARHTESGWNCPALLVPRNTELTDI